MKIIAVVIVDYFVCVWHCTVFTNEL